MASGPDIDDYPGSGEGDIADMEGSGDAMAMVFDEEEGHAMAQADVSPEQSLGE
jgi:hypothetical protein